MLWWLDALQKNREDYVRKFFGIKEKETGFKYNYSLALITFRTTGPWHN